MKGGQLVRERVREILGRHQIPVVASGRSGSFDPESVHMAFSLGASKYIALLNDHKVPSLDGRPIAAILESEVAGLAGNANCLTRRRKPAGRESPACICWTEKCAACWWRNSSLKKA